MKILSSLIALLISFSFVFSLVSCSGKDDVNTKFIYEKADDHIVITGYSGIEEEISIPSEIEGLPVTVIAENAFYGMINLKKVTISDSVVTMDYAFTECDDLESVVIGKGVLSMSGAFKGCSSLNSVSGGENARELSEAYANCTSLQAAVIPSSATNCMSTFSGCTALTSVTIKSGITSLPYTFSSCSSLTSIGLPSSVTSLVSTFEDCTSLTTVTGTENVTEIDSAFKNCSSLLTLTLGGSIRVLKSAFINCSSLVSVNGLPRSVEAYTASFTGCSSITDIIIPAVAEDGTSSSYMFVNDVSGCTSLTTITVLQPFLATAEFCKTFENCSSLLEVNLPTENTREFLRVDSTYTDVLYEGNLSSVSKAVSNCKKNNKVRVADDFGFVDGVSYTHIHGGDVEFFDCDDVAAKTDVIDFEPFSKTYYWCGYPKGTNYKTKTVALQRTHDFYLRVTGKSNGTLPSTVIVNGMICVIESE